MIQVNNITKHNYTTIIDGNDGEDQIIITSSPSQSGHIALLIVHVQVDGGLEIILNIPHGILKFDDLNQTLKENLLPYFSNKDIKKIVEIYG